MPMCPSLPSLPQAFQGAPPPSRRQLRPPSPARQAGANSGEQPAGSVPGPAADSASQQGAGDFAEAAVEAIAQWLDMGGCASPTAGDVSQDEVAYTPSAMDAEEPFSHSKVHSTQAWLEGCMNNFEQPLSDCGNLWHIAQQSSAAHEECCSLVGGDATKLPAGIGAPPRLWQQGRRGRRHPLRHPER